MRFLLSFALFIAAGCAGGSPTAEPTPGKSAYPPAPISDVIAFYLTENRTEAARTLMDDWGTDRAAEPAWMEIRPRMVELRDKRDALDKSLTAKLGGDW